MNLLLAELYRSPRIGLRNDLKLYKIAKERDPNITLKDVQNFLRSSVTHTTHLLKRTKKFPRRRVVISKPRHTLTCDLADMSHLSKYNDNNRFLLVCLDAFSRFMEVIPLRSKQADVVLKGMKEILDKPNWQGIKKLWTDRGKEYYNAKLKSYLREKGIKLYSVYSPLKASLVERAQRTLKSVLYKYMTEYNTFEYLSVLPEVVKGYNNHAHHRILQNTPARVHEMKDPDSIIRQFHRMHYKKRPHTRKKSSKPLAIGATVRLVGSSRTSPFAKGYLAHNTTEIFKIRKIDTSQPITTYFVEDLNGEEIEGSFYIDELVPATPPPTFPIDIIQRRGNKYRVRFRGYDSSFDQWVDKKDLVKI